MDFPGELEKGLSFKPRHKQKGQRHTEATERIIDIF